MTHREVELLAVGSGPSNLALAVALEELAPDDLAADSLIIERASSIEWQPGLLLPWAKSQVSFLKDLVTLRNPGSAFSFLNYLHTVGRLDDFINMASFYAYRIEFSDYLRWVASALSKVSIRLGCGCAAIEARKNAAGEVTGWLARLSDGSSVASRYLVVGIGRDAYLPPVFDRLPGSRLIHSTQYRPRLAELSREFPYRVTVVGGAQSAAEMFRALQHDLPNASLTWVMRSITLAAYDKAKFANELYFPAFVDEFFAARPQAREQILDEMHKTNYSGVDPELLESLYCEFYLDRLTKQNRKHLITMADITAAEMSADDIVLELTDRRTGAATELRQDLLFLGTGFNRGMPALIRGLGRSLGLRQIQVSRPYRLMLDQPGGAACYLQGVSEASHGIADSLLSVVGHRAADIVHDILSQRADGEPGGAG